jgi:hypothetical protein
MNMDNKLVSEKQKYEAEYISKKYKIPVKVIREVMKIEGRSRKKIYAALRLLGYTIQTKKFKHVVKLPNELR